MTYEINLDGGQINSSYYSWGEADQWNDAQNVIITCDPGGNLNNADVLVLRNLILNHHLVNLNLSGATFKTDTGDYGSYTDHWLSEIWGCCIAGEVGAAMFHDCTNLQTVTLPSNITKIGHGAFYNCTSLKKVSYSGTGLVTIDRECFMHDSQLQELSGTLSNVTKINAEAFTYCSALPDAYFQNFTGVTQIEYGAFESTLISQASAQQIITNFVQGNQSPGDKGYKRIPDFAFRDCKNLIGALDLSNTNIQGIDTYAFQGCTGLTGITLSSTLNFLGTNAFAGCKNLVSVAVSAGTAPTCEANVFGSDGTNAGPEPNSCEVKFTGSADAYDASGATGYMSYRGNSTFMALLTKTMDEDNTDYTVVPQRHADVSLHRTFKAGWNTLALPFGSPGYITNKPTAGAQIFMDALHHGSADFMIAAYRGLNTTTNTFYFLKYANGADGLDEFEPILVKMGKGDITGDNKYTFSNVEVNYDADGNTEYTAAAVKPLIGTLAGKVSGKVDGSYNHDLNAKFKNCTYDKFYFTGTLCKNSVVASATSGFIQTGDYIIQDNNFYQVAEGGTYGLKGFRGWFKKFPTAGAKSSVISIDVVSGDEPTDIVKIDANGEEVNNGKVYNINGQLVGTSLNGLSKGLYIVNGKKYVVK